MQGEAFWTPRGRPTKSQAYPPSPYVYNILKNAPNTKFVPAIVFRVPSRGAGICLVGRCSEILQYYSCYTPLVAPYRAIPRDYLSDTPLLRAMGFLVSQHGRLGAIPPAPFLSTSSLESMRSGGAIIPPHKRGISAILTRDPMNQAQTRAIPPSAILSRKGIARYGGVSRTGPLSIPPYSAIHFRGQLDLSVPWSLQPRNRAAAATCGHGRCELPAILRAMPKIASG